MPDTTMYYVTLVTDPSMNRAPELETVHYSDPDRDMLNAASTHIFDVREVCYGTGAEVDGYTIEVSYDLPASATILTITFRFTGNFPNQTDRLIFKEA